MALGLEVTRMNLLWRQENHFYDRSSGTKAAQATFESRTCCLASWSEDDPSRSSFMARWVFVPANRDVGDGDDGSRLGGDKNELALEAGESLLRNFRESHMLLSKLVGR
jgi:hypothetical protein